MGLRLWRWVRWSVLISLFPFAGSTVIRIYNTQSWPAPSDLVNSGQLLITSIALLAGGLREISAMPEARRGEISDGILSSTLPFCGILAVVYGLVANQALSGSRQSTAQSDLVTIFSLIAFGLSLVMAAAATAIATPETTE